MDSQKLMLDWFERWNLQPRKQQLDVIESLASGWNKKYQIVDAPTGVGKQFIGLSAAYAAGNAFALTHTKQLQDQYITGPGGCVDLRGRSNYPCGINPTMTAENAPCISFKPLLRKCAARGCCPYMEQRKAAMNADVFLTNYSYFLYSRLCGPLKEMRAANGEDLRRNLLICDEGHTMEGHLVSFAETILDPQELKDEYGLYKMEWEFQGSDKENKEIVNDITSEVFAKWNDEEINLKEVYRNAGIQDGDGLSEALIKKIPEKEKRKIAALVKEHDKTDKLYKRLNLYRQSSKGSEWIIHAETEKNTLTLSPLTAGGLYNQFCTPAAHKHMFLSATIGCPEEFAAELGLPLDECNFVTVDDSFDSEKSPIVFIGVGKFNYSEIDSTLPKAVKLVDQLLEMHKTDKGIIHTANYRISKYFAEKSKHRGRLVHRDMERWSLNNEKLIGIHKKRKDASVLLSPSMNTGISLDDDLARFQIIAKLPFASLGDPRVKIKSQRSKNWYINKMWQEIMQAAGRSTRSEDDYCVTYILDESWEYFFKQWRSKLPPWFVRRVEL
jgi:Rad3-related DNA helicase